MFVQTQGRKSTVKQPRTFRRNLRRGTSQPLRRSTATWLALLIQPIFNSCSTQSQMSLSPIIFVAAVSIEDKYSPVAEPIDRHTHIWLNSHSYPYTEHMCCIARTRERVRMRDYDNVSYWEKDWVTERERMAERTGRERDIPMYHRYYYRPPADTFSIFITKQTFYASPFNVFPYRTNRRFDADSNIYISNVLFISWYEEKAKNSFLNKIYKIVKWYC